MYGSDSTVQLLSVEKLHTTQYLSTIVDYWITGLLEHSSTTVKGKNNYKYKVNMRRK
jgi:hypothetical protein